MARSKTGKLIGSARVSTEDQSTEAQAQALKAAGCAEIHEEQASGGNRARPDLARLGERIEPGQTLVVVRIDRLARSLSHLLEVIEKLEARGAFFRSLLDPIDTASPQGKFTLLQSGVGQGWVARGRNGPRPPNTRRRSWPFRRHLHQIDAPRLDPRPSFGIAQFGRSPK